MVSNSVVQESADQVRRICYKNTEGVMEASRQAQRIVVVPVREAAEHLHMQEVASARLR